MAGLKELRGRIEAIKSTEKITSAMKMVAAARLRKAQDILDKSVSYRNNLYTVAGRLWQMMSRQVVESQKDMPLPAICRSHAENKNYLLVVLSSDRGLCGSYNSTISRTAMLRTEELKATGKNVKIICLGARCYNALKRHYQEEIIRHDESAANKGVDYEEAQNLGAEILSMFIGNEIDVCEIVYSHFRSAMSRDVKSKQVLPLTPSMLVQDAPSEMYKDAFFESEPKPEEMFAQVMPLVLEEVLFDIMINSQASEQGARMTSMDNATRNAKDMISKLTLRYNRMRQSAITTELVEIIAGAEAV